MLIIHHTLHNNRKKYLSSDTLPKIARKSRFCRTRATNHETNLAFSGIRRDNFLTIFLIKVYLYDNIFTINIKTLFLEAIIYAIFK